MTDDLAEIERIAGALVRSLAAGERRALMRKMARALAISQRERITAQRQPDGSAFEKRKDMGDRPHDDRLRHRGRRYPLVRVQQDREVAPVPEEHGAAAGGRLRRRGGLRRRAMYRRLASSRFLKTEADDQGFCVGFTGKVSQIADVHQNGLRDRPSLRAKSVAYPKREPLGPTAADRDRLLETLYEHLSQNSG